MFQVCECTVLHRHFTREWLFWVHGRSLLLVKFSQHERAIQLARVYSIFRKCLRGTKMLLFFLSPASEICFSVNGTSPGGRPVNLCLFCGTETVLVLWEIKHGYRSDYQSFNRQHSLFYVLAELQIWCFHVNSCESDSSGHVYWKPFLSVQQAEQKTDPLEPKKARATLYIATVKETLSQQNYDLFSKALQHYKKTDDFHAMLSQMSSLFLEDEKKHVLLRGMTTSWVSL